MTATPEQKTAAIKTLAPIAYRIQRETTLPAWLLIGQACGESTFLLAQSGKNNFLGCKHFAGDAGKTLCQTWENLSARDVALYRNSTDGRKILSEGTPDPETGLIPCKVLDWFADFASLEDCCRWRAKRWMNGSHLPWVREYFEDPDLPGAHHKLAWNVAKSGYATGKPNDYADLVVGIGDSLEVKAALAAAAAKAQMAPAIT